MAEYVGRVGTFFASTDGISYTQVSGVFSIESVHNMGRIDDTDFDSAGAMEGEYGEDSVTFSAEWYRDDSDAGQDIIRTAIGGRSALFLRHRPEETSGADQISARVIPTALTTPNARSAMVTQSLTAESSGAVTRDTQ